MNGVSFYSFVGRGLLVGCLFWPFLLGADAKRKGFSPAMFRSPFVSWGISPSNPASINLLNAWKKFEKKKDVVVAVVDTGIEFDHPFLRDNHYLPNGARPTRTNFGRDFSRYGTNKAAPHDKHGHGTHVAGIIKSVFPDVKLLSLKYYDPNSSGSENLRGTIEALRYAVNNNVDIINYSGGGDSASMEELKILKEAERKGIIVVAAAGNNQSNIDMPGKGYYPASYNLSNIISVAAHNQRNTLLPSSNFGRKTVGLAAPGKRIRSALPGRSSGYLTGTSQGTSFVTGAVALIKSKRPSLSHRAIRDIIINSAKKEAALVRKCRSDGRLNAERALGIADNMAGGGGGKLPRSKVTAKRPKKR